MKLNSKHNMKSGIVKLELSIFPFKQDSYSVLCLLIVYMTILMIYQHIGMIDSNGNYILLHQILL